MMRRRVPWVSLLFVFEAGARFSEGPDASHMGIPNPIILAAALVSAWIFLPRQDEQARGLTR